VSNLLNEAKKSQVLALGHLGWSIRRIQRETGVDRGTITAHLKAAAVPVRPVGHRNPPPPANPATQVTTGFNPDHPPKPDPAPARSACLPYSELIAGALLHGRNATSIWQELVDKHGFSAAYESVKRYVRKLQGPSSPEARVIIHTAPGQEAQVDYGTGPLVRDPKTRLYRRTRLFVLTLGFSRKCVRLLTFQSSSRTWCELHETAFRRLGGVPAVIVLDNLAEGVKEADFCDPVLNPLFRDMLAHYRATALPCRVRDPDRKGKVESGVAHAQKTPLRGQNYESLAEAQTALDHWEERWADTRIHGTTKRQVSAMFAEEKPFLQPLPLEPFRYYQHGERKVHLDGCIEVEAAYYGTPPGWVGRSVHVQWDGLYVRILNPATGQLLREHIHQKRGGYRIKDEDRPSKTPPQLSALLGRATAIGPHTGQFCAQLHAQQSELVTRRIFAVFGLLKKYGAARLEQACGIALELRVYDYHFVGRYLERHSPLQQVHPLIRDLTVYLERIEEKAKEAHK
jgi:transposase